MMGAVCIAGRHAWWGGFRCGSGGGHAWEERRPLQRSVRILQECILVHHSIASNQTAQGGENFA